MSAHLSGSQLKEVGVDYITATSHPGHATAALGDFGRWLVAEEVSQGCKHSDWRASGYRGFHAGHVAYGYSNQGGIVRASGQCASDHWQQLLNLATNVTRLDIQVTVVPALGTTATLSRHHKELRKAPRYRGKPASFKVWYGPDGPEAAVIGKRVSDRFGRVYDKWRESLNEEYRDCLRYELELHRHVALRMANDLDASERWQDDVIYHVREFMRLRGLRCAISAGCSSSRPEPEGSRAYQREIMRTAGRSHPEVTRSIRWMANSVAPSVKRLIESGHRAEVLRALGLSCGTPEFEQSRTFAPGNFDKWR